MPNIVELGNLWACFHLFVYFKNLPFEIFYKKVGNMREIQQLNTSCTSESQTKGCYNLPFTPAFTSRENSE